MKKFLIAATVASAFSFSSPVNAAVTFGGTALLNTPGLTAGQFGILLNDNNGSGFSSLAGNIQAGLPVNLSSTYSGSWGSFSVLNSGALSTEFFGSISLSGAATFDPVGGISTGDSFALVLYSSSTANTIAADPVSIWTAPNWTIPSDGATLTWPANFTQMDGSSSPAVTTSVVPEPSTYALLALGALALGGYASRRRSRK